MTKLRQETAKVLADKGFQDALRAQGAEGSSGSAGEFAELIKTDLKKWSVIVKQTGAEIN